MKTDEQQNAERELYNKVRGAFVAQGLSLTQWCEKNGIHVTNFRHAFYGSWNGPAAKKLVKKACKDAGVDYQVEA